MLCGEKFSTTFIARLSVIRVRCGQSTSTATRQTTWPPECASIWREDESSVVNLHERSKHFASTLVFFVHNRNGFPIEWAVSVQPLRYRLWLREDAIARH